MVRWHSVSTDDGHALEGSFSFGVRASALGGQHTLVQSPLARGGLLRIGLRGLLRRRRSAGPVVPAKN